MTHRGNMMPRLHRHHSKPDEVEHTNAPEGTQEKKELALQVLRVHAQRQIPLALLEAADGRIAYNSAAEALVLELSLSFWSTKLGEFAWPATWWQGVRERFFPQFILKRWPSKFVSVRLDVILQDLTSDARRYPPGHVLKLVWRHGGKTGIYPFLEPRAVNETEEKGRTK